MAHGSHKISIEQLVEERPYLEGIAPKVMAVGVLIGVVCLGAAFMLGNGQGDNLRHFQFAYLINFIFFISLALGGLVFTIIQHLTRATWSVVVRRFAEVFASTLPFMALLALPVIVPALSGNYGLFSWLDPQAVSNDHSGLLARKAPYLSQGFWLLRLAVYFVIWGILATYFHRSSLKQDQSGDKRITLGMWRASAPAVVLFAITATFFAIDMVMTLNPLWFSTIFGVYFFAGCFISFVALLFLAVLSVQGTGRLKRTVTVDHRHDLGKLMFAFTLFWAYISFSQYMLIWYANIPEETGWYLVRQSGAWLPVFIALAACHFAIPFLGLMPRGIKRRRRNLAFWAVWVLLAHWLDLYWLIMPEFSPGMPVFSALEVLCFLGVGGLFIACAAMLAAGKALVPLKDPQLAESLRFENV